jgi:hypothetical protein
VSNEHIKKPELEFLDVLLTGLSVALSYAQFVKVSTVVNPQPYLETNTNSMYVEISTISNPTELSSIE